MPSPGVPLQLFQLWTFLNTSPLDFRRSMSTDDFATDLEPDSELDMVPLFPNSSRLASAEGDAEGDAENPLH
ncbi:hypothetical protein MKZ38_005886 [Zalerion maritima]|uniref:Uncharacterized protein n=1 Tax=Zalerion maritima TaxID=339359 RepID=A0AAD5RKK7_9PEZI|nr:hypothetical protein MKZ38_005886 [Zalerion maritima]